MGIPEGALQPAGLSKPLHQDHFIIIIHISKILSFIGKSAGNKNNNCLKVIKASLFSLYIEVQICVPVCHS